MLKCTANGEPGAGAGGFDREKPGPPPRERARFSDA